MDNKVKSKKYFTIIRDSIYAKKTERKKELMEIRRKRKSIKKEEPKRGKMFTRGDIFSITFWSKTMKYKLDGLCIAIKNKKLLNQKTTILGRNVLDGVAIEMSASYYYNRLSKRIKIADFKRKKYDYRKSKLYFLRSKENIATKVKKG